MRKYRYTSIHFVHTNNWTVWATIMSKSCIIILTVPYVLCVFMCGAVYASFCIQNSCCYCCCLYISYNRYSHRFNIRIYVTHNGHRHFNNYWNFKSKRHIQNVFLIVSVVNCGNVRPFHVNLLNIEEKKYKKNFRLSKFLFHINLFVYLFINHTYDRYNFDFVGVAVVACCYS